MTDIPPGADNPAPMERQGVVLIGTGGEKLPPPVTVSAEAAPVVDLNKTLVTSALNTVLEGKTLAEQRILLDLLQVEIQARQTVLSAPPEEQVEPPSLNDHLAQQSSVTAQPSIEQSQYGPKTLAETAQDACKDKNSKTYDLLQLTKDAVAKKDTATLTVLLDELNERTFIEISVKGKKQARLDSGYGSNAIDTMREVLGHAEGLLTADSDEIKSQGGVVLDKTKEALTKLFEGYPDWSVPETFVPMLETYEKAVRVEVGKDDVSAAKETMGIIEQFRLAMQTHNPNQYKDQEYVQAGFYTDFNANVQSTLFQLGRYFEEVQKRAATETA